MLNNEMPMMKKIIIRSILGEERINKFKEIQNKWLSNDNFDLYEYCLNLRWHLVKANTTNEFLRERNKNYATLQKLIKSEKTPNLKRSFFKKLSQPFINEIGLSLRDDNETILKKCDNFIQRVNWQTSRKKRKNYRISKKFYIGGLAWIYYYLTGNIPECKKYRCEPRKFRGKFYQFLIEIIPLLKMLDIHLGGADENIGRHIKNKAFQKTMVEIYNKYSPSYSR